MKEQELDIKIKANHCQECETKPCQSGCPEHMDIPEFIKQIKKENYAKSYRILCESNAATANCGSGCLYEKQCQKFCAKGISYEPVQIAKLADYITKMAKDDEQIAKEG